MLTRISRDRRKQYRLSWLWPWIIIILASILILLPQIIGTHLIVGEDCWFHMNRAYEDMEQIKTGHFSYFMNLFSFNSSGRIVNGIYGPLGGYLEGLLLLVVKSWYRWEITNSLVVLIVSGLSMYYVARKLDVTMFPSILAGLFYLASFPFDRWVLSQNGDGFGAMLLPWFILAGYRIYQHKFSSVKLALLVTVMSQLHLMSTIVGITSLFVSFILANFRSGRIKVWLKTGEAAALCLLLTVNVWGAVLEVKSSNHLVPPVPYRKFLSMSHAINVRMAEAPIVNYVIVELFLFVVLGLIWFVCHHKDDLVGFLFIQGGLFLFLASTYFPWALLLAQHPMLRSYLQFPERFMPITIVALILLVIQIKPKVLVITALFVLVALNIGLAYQKDQDFVGMQYRHLMQTTRNVELKPSVSFQSIERALHSNNAGTFLHIAQNNVPDYIPSQININQVSKYNQLHPYSKNFHDIVNNHLRIHKSVISRNVARLTFNARPDHQVKVPFVKYRHTKLWLNHKLIKPRLTIINTIEIKPRQRHNVLEAQYQPSQWYQIMVIAELFMWLSFIINLVAWRLLSRRI